MLRFDELIVGGNNLRVKASEVNTVQRCYPQIYLACHKKHIRAASTAHRLSSRDSSLLVHLDSTAPVTTSKLASHMGVRGSTLSAAIAKLAKLGYLKRSQDSRDRRVAGLTLTAKGEEAMAETSVLDRERVHDLLARLTRAERKQALTGLELLAKAACQLGREGRTKE